MPPLPKMPQHLKHPTWKRPEVVIIEQQISEYYKNVVRKSFYEEQLVKSHNFKLKESGNATE